MSPRYNSEFYILPKPQWPHPNNQQIECVADMWGHELRDVRVGKYVLAALNARSRRGARKAAQRMAKDTLVQELTEEADIVVTKAVDDERSPEIAVPADSPVDRYRLKFRVVPKAGITDPTSSTLNDIMVPNFVERGVVRSKQNVEFSSYGKVVEGTLTAKNGGDAADKSSELINVPAIGKPTLEQLTVINLGPVD